MSSIDEGVSLNQLLPLYIKYRIRYHCVNFKYHKTASHSDQGYKANENYPVLFYMIEGTHLYPIREAVQQRSISQKTIEQGKTYHHKTNTKPHERTTHVFNHPEDILMMLGEMKYEQHRTFFDFDECKNDIFVCEIREVVHNLFYNFLRKINYTIKCSSRKQYN